MWGYCGGKLGLPMLAYFMNVDDMVEVDILTNVLGVYSRGYRPYPSDLCSLQVLLLVSTHISYRSLPVYPTALCPYILPFSARISYRSLPVISYWSLPVYPTGLCPYILPISACYILHVFARRMLVFITIII